MNLDEAFEDAANKALPIYKKDPKCSPRSLQARQVCEVPRKIEVQVIFGDETASTVTTIYDETEPFTDERRAMVQVGFWYVLGKVHGTVLTMLNVAQTLMEAIKEKQING